ncbi:MAG TPA: hypothetical protein VGF27_23955, partial [Pseudoduganella sp.]
MFASDSSPFPLVGLKPVSNTQNQWVALAFQPVPGVAPGALLSLLSDPDAQALASLDCIIPLADPLQLELSHLDGLATGRIVFSIPATACDDEAALKRCAVLSDAGCRLLVEGEAGIHASRAGVRGLNVDCSAALQSTFRPRTPARAAWMPASPSTSRRQPASDRTAQRFSAASS